MTPPSPAIVAQHAVRRLPRWMLWLLCAAYVLAGFIGRNPWRETDLASLGYMRSIANGDSSWLHPTLLGMAPDHAGLLPYWLGAWALHLFPSSVDPAWVVRLPFMLLLGMTLISMWWAVYYLARTPGAQPVAFAFGGEANPQDYARAMADGGLLALLACLGLAQLSHETSSYLAQLAFTSMTMLAASAMAYHPRWAAGLALSGLLGLTLSDAPSIAILIGVSIAALTYYTRNGHLHKQRTWAAWWLCLAAFMTLIAWKLDLWQWRILDWATRDREVRSLGKLLLWFSWPAWPLALWTLWRWRRHVAAPGRYTHLSIPLGLWCLTLATTLLTEPADRALLLGMPAIATLAAFALPTLRRSLSALIDWLTLIFFSVSAITIWVVWISLQTGVPAKPAENVARLAPGFEHQFTWFPFVVAVIATVAWILLAAWRTRRHRAAIWKSLVLPAGGTTLGWILLMTLWLPALDYGRSMQPMVARIQSHIPAATPCIAAAGLARSQIAALQYHTDWQIEAFSPSTPKGCPWVISQPTFWNQQPAEVSEHWRLAAQVTRPTDRNDRLLVLQRR